MDATESAIATALIKADAEHQRELREANERWFASNRIIRQLEDKLARVEALPAKWRERYGSDWADRGDDVACADELEAALKD